MHKSTPEEGEGVKQGPDDGWPVSSFFMKMELVMEVVISF